MAFLLTKYKIFVVHELFLLFYEYKIKLLSLQNSSVEGFKILSAFILNNALSGNLQGQKLYVIIYSDISAIAERRDTFINVIMKLHK